LTCVWIYTVNGYPARIHVTGRRTLHCFKIRWMIRKTEKSPDCGRKTKYNLFSPMTFCILFTKAVVMDKKKVKDYMTYDVVSIDIHGSVKDVIEKIQKTHHDGFPVIDGDEVVGYISARDLLFVQLSTPVREVVSRNLIVADPEMDINDAARVIFRSGIQKLPVVDEKNHLLGIISNSDVIRSQIEHVSPEKVFNFMTTLKKLYGVDPTLDRGTVPVKDLLPTQSKIYEDELEGRIYEIKKGLAEPFIVVKRPGKIILVDGHHRAIAAKRLGITAIDAYLIEIKEDIELGMERTAHAMNLKTLDDVQVLDYARHPLVAITHRLVKRV
jgi:CBS domain-containing protein